VFPNRRRALIRETAATPVVVEVNRRQVVNQGTTNDDQTLKTLTRSKTKHLFTQLYKLEKYLLERKRVQLHIK